MIFLAYIRAISLNGRSAKVTEAPSSPSALLPLLLIHFINPPINRYVIACYIAYYRYTKNTLILPPLLRLLLIPPFFSSSSSSSPASVDVSTILQYLSRSITSGIAGVSTTGIDRLRSPFRPPRATRRHRRGSISERKLPRTYTRPRAFVRCCLALHSTTAERPRGDVPGRSLPSAVYFGLRRGATTAPLSVESPTGPSPRRAINVRNAADPLSFRFETAAMNVAAVRWISSA